MVGGNIGFSISDIRAPDDQAALLGGDSETIRGLGNSANKDRPEAVKYTRHALSWQGFGSSRAAGGAALAISDAESGDLVSDWLFSLRLRPWLRTGQVDLEYASPLADRTRTALERLCNRGDAFASRRHRS
jgi:hypothetical protein